MFLGMRGAEPLSAIGSITVGGLIAGTYMPFEYKYSESLSASLTLTVLIEE